MINFKTGLISSIGTIASIPILVLLIIFSSLHGTALDIVFFTLFGSFSLLFFLFSTLYNWIKNETCQNIFKRFVNIFKILTMFVVILILTFSEVPTNLKWTFLGISTGIVIIWTIFSAIWKKIPDTLLSILTVLTYILFCLFLFILILI